jgi:CRP/FNR family transcriptional regulator
MHVSALRCDQCAVRNRAVCTALAPEERRELARLGHRRLLKRGETLFSAGDRNTLSATLTTGVLKLSSFDPDGTEHIVSLIHPAGFAGELFQPVAHYHVIAVTDCDLCVFPRREYEAALDRFPALGRAMLRRSAAALVDSRALLAAVTRRSARRRLAAFLIALGRAANDVDCHPAERFDLVLSRAEIASLLGMTIETVSRQLSRLEQERLIRRDGLRGIELVDAARLEQLAA